MKNPYHGTEIVVNADRPDWAKRWGVIGKDAEGCWCYSCWFEHIRRTGVVKADKEKAENMAVNGRNKEGNMPNEKNLYRQWGKERRAKGEDPNDTVDFAKHLRAIGKLYWFNIEAFGSPTSLLWSDFAAHFFSLQERVEALEKAGEPGSPFP